MDHYLSDFKPLKGDKTFHHTEIDNNKTHGNLLSSDCPNKGINRNSLSLSVVNFFE